MCLALPGELVELRTDDRALVRVAGRTVSVSLMTLDEPAAPGDWVLLHSGFALARLTREEALSTLAVLRGSTQLSP